MRVTQVLSRLDPWAPPLALMGLIFFLSAQPDLNSGLGVFDLIGRKLVHAGEYALLCFLWWRALRRVIPERRAALFALMIAFAYSCTDELHQTFLRRRPGTPGDVAIDLAGAGSAAGAPRRRPP